MAAANTCERVLFWKGRPLTRGRRARAEEEASQPQPLLSFVFDTATNTKQQSGRIILKGNMIESCFNKRDKGTITSTNQIRTSF